MQSFSSFAANKALGACPKLGKTATIEKVRFTCTKSGKKLIWTVTSGLAPIDQKLEMLSDSIKEKLISTKSNINLSLNVDPLLSTSQWSKDSISSISTANKLLTVLDIRQINEQKIYISWGGDYRNQFTPSYCNKPSGGGLCGHTGILFADLKWFADNWGYAGVEAPYKSEMDKFTITANLQHEIGHYGQEESAASAGNTDYWKYSPGWLREGVAEYFKLLTSAYDNKVSYKKLHDMYLKNSGSQRCTKYSLLEMSSENFNSGGCEYSKGLFAAELLVYKTGRVESIFEMEKTIGTDTAEIFQKAFGFSLANFCKEVDLYFAQITSNIR